jgi:hypothetical protein
MGIMHASAGGTPTPNTTAFRPDTQPSPTARIERNPITGTLNKTALTTSVGVMSGTPKETNCSCIAVVSALAGLWGLLPT